MHTRNTYAARNVRPLNRGIPTPPPDPTDNGPFGTHSKPGRERLMNLSVTQEGIPKDEVELFNMDRRYIYWHGVQVGVYRWVGKDFIVRWQGEMEQYNQQQFIQMPGGFRRANFRLSLSIRDSACLELRGTLVTKELLAFIKTSMFPSHTNLEGRRLSLVSNAKMIELNEHPGSEAIVIEFMTSNDLSKAKAWVTYLNQNYRAVR
jgi:hypothetical protein